MNNNRPYNQKYTKKTDAWNHVSADVNAASPSFPALGLSAIRKKVESLRKDYRKKQRADRSATGTNDSETQLDELIRTFDEMMTSQEQEKSMDDSGKRSAMIKKRTDQALQTARALTGRTISEKAKGKRRQREAEPEYTNRSNSQEDEEIIVTGDDNTISERSIRDKRACLSKNDINGY
ncbi:hypothetical protein G6F56_009922 [Rhizopus delemar]|nr:hypothetical protein G6F56_009922 [Rhizopus delemar]